MAYVLKGEEELYKALYLLIMRLAFQIFLKNVCTLAWDC